jgi:hypothetical protein
MPKHKTEAREQVGDGGEPLVLILVSRVLPVLRLYEMVLDVRQIHSEVQKPPHFLADEAVVSRALRKAKDTLKAC